MDRGAGQQGIEAGAGAPPVPVPQAAEPASPAGAPAPSRHEPADPALAPGGTFGRFRILRELGHGGMATVYLAEDLALRRRVALKLLPRTMARDPESLRRFRREARAAAALDHPNIVAVHSIEIVARRHVIVMEWIDGKSLADLVPSGGFPVGTLLSIGRQIARACAAAHDAGIVHRDLKCANIMVDAAGHVTILDFGLAKIRLQAEEAPAGITASLPTRGFGVGTTAYMAPEALNGRRTDRCADIFSLGVILYRMAAGRLPFIGESWAAAVSAILRDAPTPLASRRRDLPGGLYGIIERCLQKRPQDRFQSARALLAALEECPIPGGPDAHPPRGGVEVGLGGSPRSGTREPERSGPDPAEKHASSDAPAAGGIAVLPFLCLSPMEADRFLADGVVEECTGALAGVPGLRVVSRTSCFALRDRACDVPRAARRLRVRYLLEGSVRRAGETVRITAQLIDAVADAHLWSLTWTRRGGDPLALQDEVARGVAAAFLPFA